MNTEIMNDLKKLNVGEVKEYELLKNYTTLKIGGPSDVMVLPEKIEHLSKLIKYCYQNKVSYTVIGMGSNILVSDKGIRGIVIVLRENFSEITINANQVTAYAGASLRNVSKLSFENSLTGMEAVSGIPGTVGGAIIMNAGAYGTEMKDIVKSVVCMDSNGEVFEYDNEKMEFSYRNSIASEKGLIVVSATFNLDFGNKEEIYLKFEEFDLKRSTKQPLESYSAGSTFKRPDGYYASKLIDDAGLRGFTVKNAMVSEKHCGFLINKGESTCENFLELVSEVTKIVKNKYGVTLEREIKLIGER